ncbi:MAG: ATP synthase F1 subunit delta [Phycisphaerales bacterium]
MALTQSDPNAVSNVYAKSLYQLADSKGGRAQVETCLAELEAILDLAQSTPNFGEFLSSRAVSESDRAAALQKIFKGRISDLTNSFLQVLNAKGRLSVLPSIVTAFDMVVQEKFGRVEVDVFTAEPIDEELKNTLRSRLQVVMGKEVVLHSYLDGAMIAGVKLRVGDQLIDGSVATQLRAMRDRIEVHGGSELRSRVTKILE